MSKLIIITAPSGAGKTTIVKHLLKQFDQLTFSISATTRACRPHEEEGIDYYFLNLNDFKQLIGKEAFIEWEEVYNNQFYGTLKSEVERLWAENKDIIFDIDVKGAINIKNSYPDASLVIFIAPPSMEILHERLQQRETEDEESLLQRQDRAQEEMDYQELCDRIIINDNLENALKEVEQVVTEFLNK